MQKLRMARYMYSRLRVRLSLDSQYQFRVSEGGREGGEGGNEGVCVAPGDVLGGYMIISTPSASLAPMNPSLPSLPPSLPPNLLEPKSSEGIVLVARKAA